MQLKFEKIRKGEYRSQLRGGAFIWVLRESPHRWVWYLGGYDARGVWETDTNGPFATRREAIADAIANYEDLLS